MCEIPRQPRPHAASEADADEEHGQDDREGVGRSTEQQGEEARPDDFGTERAQARQRDGEIDQSRAAGKRNDACSRRGFRLLVRCRTREAKGGKRYRGVDRDGNERGGGHVVHAQQVEPCEQAAKHGAGRVAAVEETHPGNAFRRGFHPTRDGG